MNHRSISFSVVAVLFLLTGCRNEETSDFLSEEISDPISSFVSETPSESSFKEEKTIKRQLVFGGYQFVYYQDGTGSVLSDSSKEVLQDTKSYSFKKYNLNKVQIGDSLLKVVKTIGFPRFLGISSTLSLDFGEFDYDIYRMTFSDDLHLTNSETLDYGDYTSWIDPLKKDLPSQKDIEKIQLGMSLDEVVSLIGRPQTTTGSGAIIYNFDLVDGSTFLTWWDTRIYQLRNGPYYLSRMEIES